MPSFSAPGTERQSVSTLSLPVGHRSAALLQARLASCPHVSFLILPLLLTITAVVHPPGMTIWHCLPRCLCSGSCILRSTWSGLPGCPQAPFLSDTCSSVPVAGVCSPAGTVLGLRALHHLHTQRARHAWDMVTWPPPPSPSTLSLTDLCGVGRPAPCLGQDISDAWLTLQRGPPTPSLRREMPSRPFA